MNREIKFRAWDKENNRWLTNYEECFIGEDGCCYIKEESGGYYSTMYLKRVESDIQLFTGLKDKNGKEIYEGDIFKYYHHGGYNLESFISNVVWDETDATFGYMVKSDFGEFVHPFSDHHELVNDFLFFTEVIGNIYETPHLLNSGQEDKRSVAMDDAQ